MGILTILQENTCRDAVMVDNLLKSSSMYCITNVYKVQSGKHLVTKNGIVRNFQKNFHELHLLTTYHIPNQKPKNPKPCVKKSWTGSLIDLLTVILRCKSW